MTYWEPDQTNWDTIRYCQHNQWLAIKRNTNHLLCKHCLHTSNLPKTWHRNRRTHLELQPPITTTPPPRSSPGLSSGTGYIRGKTV